MVFAVDMGHNASFSVRQGMTSPYQLCDNRWHSVKANYVENALTLKVDAMDEQYAFSSSGHVIETSAPHPLFIGGLPGSSLPSLPPSISFSIYLSSPGYSYYFYGLIDADMEPQGTLSVRDNFKGCIRNVVIRGQIKDWTDMARLNNVLLNACPIQ